MGAKTLPDRIFREGMGHASSDERFSISQEILHRRNRARDSRTFENKDIIHGGGSSHSGSSSGVTPISNIGSKGYRNTGRR